MKLTCTYINPQFAAALSLAFTLGREYCATEKPGSLINAVNVMGEHYCGGTFGYSWIARPKPGAKGVYVVCVGNDEIVCEFTRFKRMPLPKTEKRVHAKLDGAGKIDKRRYRRVCRQYCKLKDVNASYYCPISHQHMKRIARFHRR